MDYNSKLTGDELQALLIALEGNKQLQISIKIQAWEQVKVSA